VTNRYVALGCYWPGLVRGGATLAVVVMLLADWLMPYALVFFAGWVVGQRVLEWDQRGRRWMREHP